MLTVKKKIEKCQDIKNALVFMASVHHLLENQESHRQPRADEEPTHLWQTQLIQHFCVSEAESLVIA